MLKMEFNADDRRNARAGFLTALFMVPAVAGGLSGIVPLVTAIGLVCQKKTRKGALVGLAGGAALIVSAASAFEVAVWAGRQRDRAAEAAPAPMVPPPPKFMP